MKTRGILWISTGILIFALFSVWLRLPTTSGDIWMSPDETANIVSAISFAENGQFGFRSELTEKFIWAHPRSFVYVPETNLVSPIGFLGMPLILSFIYKIFGLLGINFFAPLLALATLYPFWRIMPKSWSKVTKLVSLIIWMTLPTVIIYTNRGTFPQLTQLCFTVWVWFFITTTITATKYQHLFDKIRLPLAGILSALALIIRPVEAIWIVPVIIFAYLHQLKNTDQSLRFLRDTVVFLVPFLLILLIGAKLGADTYGKWFVSGYQIRPTTTNVELGTQNSELEIDNVSGLSLDEQAGGSYSTSVSFFDTLPFSFHPMHIWWNFKHYIVWMLLPWSVLLFGSLLILIKDRCWKSKNIWALSAIVWSSAAVILFYGNGIYQDHVRLNEISIGNSFLRYTLLLSIPIALSVGFIFSRLWKHWSLKILATTLVVGLATYGIWLANAGSDESLLRAEQELISYQQVRNAAARNFPEDGIILSDRSDKIFFPKYFAISPLPSNEQISDLGATDKSIRIYLPTQDEEGLQKWEENGFLLTPVFTIGNQTLYNIY